jgi:hypothetical protein
VRWDRTAPIRQGTDKLLVVRDDRIVRLGSLDDYCGLLWLPGLIVTPEVSRHERAESCAWLKYGSIWLLN